MTTKIFVNLPVKDLNRAVEFFTKLGFKFNPQFTDKNATCMIISEDIFVMLLVEEFFKTFTKKEICNTSKNIEAIIALSAESRENVDEMINKAIEAGGIEPRKPQDHVKIGSKKNSFNQKFLKYFYIKGSTDKYFKRNNVL